jgi:hypothetical protein
MLIIMTADPFKTGVILSVVFGYFGDKSAPYELKSYS